MSEGTCHADIVFCDPSQSYSHHEHNVSHDPRHTRVGHDNTAFAEAVACRRQAYPSQCDPSSAMRTRSCLENHGHDARAAVRGGAVARRFQLRDRARHNAGSSRGAPATGDPPEFAGKSHSKIHLQKIHDRRGPGGLICETL